MTYRIKNIETGKIENWTLTQILHEINHGRSNKWKPYDKTDWREGWNHWCEGEQYTLMIG